MRYAPVRILKIFQVFLLFIALNAGADDALNHWFYRNSTPVNRVRFVGGLFLAVGNSGVLLTSPNGSNWTSRVTGTTANLYGAAAMQLGAVTNYVVVGDGGTILTSTNAINWTLQYLAAYSLNDIIDAGDYEFVTAATAGNAPLIYYSTLYSINNTPTQWTNSSFAGGGNDQGGGPYTASTVCFDGDDFTLVTADGGGASFAYDIWTSFDLGETWTKTGFSDQQVTGIAYGNGTIVIVGFEGWPRESTNGGSDWFVVQSTNLDPYYYAGGGLPMIGNDIVFGNGRFVVADANSYSTDLLVSTNGLDWKGITPTRPNMNARSITFGKGTYVAANWVSDNSGTIPPGIYQSMPVSTPFIAASQLTNTNAMDLVISGLIGQKYRLQTSPDLSSWSNLWIYTNTGPTMEYVDPVSLSVGQRFYRVVSP